VKIQLPLYKVYPGSREPTEFLMMTNTIGYRFGSAVDHTVYLFDGLNFESVLEVKGVDITPGKWIPLKN